MTGERKQIDWDVIEPHYRAGIRALKHIGEEFGVSDAAIIKHARKFGWTRNLLAKIQAKADEKVSAAMVSDLVSAGKKLTEADRIESDSTLQADVRISHRKDIGRYNSLVAKLFREVENATAKEGEESPAEILTIPQRVDCTKKLTDAAKTLITLEREAWGIKEAPVEVEVKDSRAGLPSHILELLGQK